MGMAMRTSEIIAIALLLGLGLSADLADAGTNCTCRAAGQNFQQGQITCIRGKLARCEMFLNNASWKTIADICPQASLSPLPRVRLHAGWPRRSLPSC
jgi:hypothetical protein